MQFDIFIVAAAVGLLSSAAALLVKAVNLIRYFESKIDALQSKVELIKIQLDSENKLVRRELEIFDHRVQDLENFSEKFSSFQPRFTKDNSDN